MFKWKIVGGIAAATLLGGALGYYNFIDKPSEGLSVGKVCPDFTARIFKVEGDTFTLSDETFTFSEHKGTVCVVNFWSTTCVPCVNEMPEFNEIYEHYEGKVQVLAAVGKSNDVEQAERWLNRKGWNDYLDTHDWADFSLPIVYMPADVCNSLGCGAALPHTLIIDQRGYVEVQHAGKTSYDSLREILDKLV